MHHILLIEDDHALRLALCELLSAAGYQITVSGDGREGLRLAVEKMPDLIVSDVGLPSLTGFEILEQLHQNEKTADIPVILLTAMGERQFVRQGMTLGADDYIAKPFEFADLQASIQTRLEKSHQRQQQIDTKINELRESVSVSLPHELRTAIMVIEGYTHLALEDSLSLDADHQHMLVQIQENAERLRSLAEKFLWHIRVQWSLPARLRAETVANCHREIERVASQIASQYGRSADLQIDLVSGEILMPGEYFQRLLTEVIDNAFKFSPAGTPVIIQAYAHANEYAIAFLDTGRGMDARQLDAVNAFTQFDRTKYEQPGTGLGLMIARRLVSLVDGKFYMDSAPGSGTLITIVIPCQVHPAATHHTTEEIPALPGVEHQAELSRVER